MDQRRLFIAILLSLIIVVLYSLVLERLYPPAPRPQRDTATQSSPAAPARSDEPAVADAPPAAAPEAGPAPSSVAAPAAAGQVLVDTDLFRAAFTTAGARLESLTLKGYRAAVAADSPPLQLVLFPVAGQLPLGLALRGEEGKLEDAAVIYAADRATVDLSGEETATITFTGRLGEATVTKRIGLRGHDYLWTVDVDVAQVPSAFTEMALTWNEGIDPAGTTASEVVFNSALVLQTNKLQTLPFTDLAAGQLLQGDIGWLGFGGPYFLAAIVPQAEPKNSLRAWTKAWPTTVETKLLFPPGVFSAHAEVYVGPKDIDRLETVGHGLRKAVDLGWFTFIALPLLQALRFLHKFTGNYGVAIIILTVVIKVLFYPLTKKSFESMREMQKLQPEMQKIRERLKDNPSEMNKEVMELYRRHKVNPLGGCLPMLLQVPVFIGLYNALLNAVELRHAPFIGWITDLSAPDRLGTLQIPFVPHPGIPVLTIIMGASMLVQQWMTPSAADPAQQRIMMIMPIIFTFMFINFPAGLTLYWLVNNILTIAQQYAIMRPRR